MYTAIYHITENVGGRQVHAFLKLMLADLKFHGTQLIDRWTS